jgi:hypothetical protein
MLKKYFCSEIGKHTELIPVFHIFVGIHSAKPSLGNLLSSGTKETGVLIASQGIRLAHGTLLKEIQMTTNKFWLLLVCERTGRERPDAKFLILGLEEWLKQ